MSLNRMAASKSKRRTGWRVISAAGSGVVASSRKLAGITQPACRRRGCRPGDSGLITLAFLIRLSGLHRRGCGHAAALGQR
jgi:hypothetical protein